jgi:hypothetical protein
LTKNVYFHKRKEVEDLGISRKVENGYMRVSRRKPPC